MSNYLSNARVHVSVPVVSTELSAATYEGITSIIRKKKTREAAALRRAAQKLKQEREQRVVARAATAYNIDGDGKEGRGQPKKKSREKAKSKITELRNELNQLLVQRAELEKSVQYKWKEKINDFEQTSREEEEEEMDKLRQEHERELKQLAEKMRAEQEDHAVEEPSRLGKRKAAREEMDESRKKRVKVVEDSATGHTDDGTRDEIAAVGNGSSQDTELDKDNGPGGNEDADNEQVPLQSAEKTKELEEITNEINCLNKTKSQMIWLLKQVITAEKKQKLR